VAVLAARDRAEEQRLLGPRPGAHAAVAVVGVVLRRLHEGRALVGLQLAQRGLQQRGIGHVVAVEHDGELGARMPQRMVDVAGLGALAPGARDVAGAVAIGDPAHRRRGAVVQQPDVHARAAQLRGRRDRRLHHRDGLVVDGDQHVDLGVRLRGGAHDRAPATALLARHRPPEAQRLREVEQLGGDQQAEQHGLSDALGSHQPGQVQQPQGDGQQRHHAHRRGGAPAAARVPGRGRQTGVGGHGRLAHW